VEGEEYSASPFPEIRLQFESDDFGPRLSPLAVLPVGLYSSVLWVTLRCMAYTLDD